MRLPKFVILGKLTYSTSVTKEIKIRTLFQVSKFSHFLAPTLFRCTLSQWSSKVLFLNLQKISDLSHLSPNFNGTKTRRVEKGLFGCL